MARKQKPKRVKFQVRPARKVKANEVPFDLAAIERRIIENEIEQEAQAAADAAYAAREAQIAKNNKKMEELKKAYGGSNHAKEASNIQRVILHKYFKHLDMPAFNYHVRCALGKTKASLNDLSFDEAETLIAYCRKDLMHLLGFGQSEEGVCEDFWKDI